MKLDLNCLSYASAILFIYTSYLWLSLYWFIINKHLINFSLPSPRTRETWPLFCSFRSSACTNRPWTIPHSPHGVLGHPERKSRQYPHQGYRFTYYTQYWWGSYHFKNTYSPITLTNISSINLVSIFRCSSSPSNPVYPRSIDFSDYSSLVFRLSSHRHSCIQDDRFWTDSPRVMIPILSDIIT
jgi:hypothetical protein